MLKLSDGCVSLEFDPSDLPRVAAAINDKFGKPGENEYVTSTVYIFGGFEFIFQNEWDDHCLISRSDGGNQVLKVLYEMLMA
ncbi:MAG TPA: hypothetical protein EYG79_08480 [Rhodobacteraceae bacterium]|nr:hypothetical protein [Paracoccaceae bacterium]